MISANRAFIKCLKFSIASMIILAVLGGCSSTQNPSTAIIPSNSNPPGGGTVSTPDAQASLNPATTISLMSAEDQKTPPSTPVSNTKIEVLTSKKTVSMGETFKVEVEINTSTALRGLQWKFSFNPRIMRLESIAEGHFFQDWAEANNGTTIMFPKPVIDNTGGEVPDMGIAVMTTASGGARGEGIICVYNFTALADRVEIPTISNVLLCDVNGDTFRLASAEY